MRKSFVSRSQARSDLSGIRSVQLSTSAAPVDAGLGRWWRAARCCRLRRRTGDKPGWQNFPVDAPWDRLAAGARPGRDVPAQEGPARRDDPLVRTGQVIDQNVEVHDGTPGIAPGRRPARDPGHALERKPLAMRRRLQRHPAWIPLGRCPAQQPRPEPGQIPRISTVCGHRVLPRLPDAGPWPGPARPPRVLLPELASFFQAEGEHLLRRDARPDRILSVKPDLERRPLAG
jgi:hypothetical protein